MIENELPLNQVTNTNFHETAPQLNIAPTASSPSTNSLQSPTPTTKRRKERRYGRLFDKQAGVLQTEEYEPGFLYESDSERSEGRPLQEDLNKPLPPAPRVSRFKEHLDEPSLGRSADNSEVNPEKAITSSKIHYSSPFRQAFGEPKEYTPNKLQKKKPADISLTTTESLEHPYTLITPIKASRTQEKHLFEDDRRPSPRQLGILPVDSTPQNPSLSQFLPPKLPRIAHHPTIRLPVALRRFSSFSAGDKKTNKPLALPEEPK
jgi:hypothetical protein